MVEVQQYREAGGRPGCRDGGGRLDNWVEGRGQGEDWRRAMRDLKMYDW